MFSGVSDEINFGRLFPVPFKYTVSSCNTNYSCGHNLFDGNRNTEWVSESAGNQEFILIDFGSKRLMNGLEWEYSNQSAQITEIQVQVQNRGEWKTLNSIISPANRGLLEFQGVDASLLKIVIQKQEGKVIFKLLSVLLNDSSITCLQSRLTGYTFPITGSFIPEDDYSIPGAPRKYRNGFHKGLDFNVYLGSDLIEQKVKQTTPILAIGDGEISRIDLEYEPMTLKEYNDITQYNQNHPVTYVDKDFGGRQIWIDHKNGVMSSYNHLSSISKNLKLGSRVVRGEIIGYAGNSGLISEAKNTKEQIHLHLEIWIDGEYLGNDLKPQQIRKLLQIFFTE